MNIKVWRFRFYMRVNVRIVKGTRKPAHVYECRRLAAFIAHTSPFSIGD